MGSKSKKDKEEAKEESISSSDEEDGDDNWKAAINAVASAYLGCSQPTPKASAAPAADDDAKTHHQPQPLKHYQIKVHTFLSLHLHSNPFLLVLLSFFISPS